MRDIRSAVAKVLEENEPGILMAPARFAGALLDMVDADLPEMRALAVGCDALWLAPYADALETRDAGELVNAAVRGADRLSSVYLVDAATAASLSRQVALGMADHLGVEPPAELAVGLDVEAGTTSAVPAAPDSQTENSVAQLDGAAGSVVPIAPVPSPARATQAIPVPAAAPAPAIPAAPAPIRTARAMPAPAAPALARQARATPVRAVPARMTPAAKPSSTR